MAAAIRGAMIVSASASASKVTVVGGGKEQKFGFTAASAPAPPPASFLLRSTTSSSACSSSSSSPSSSSSSLRSWEKRTARRYYSRRQPPAAAGVVTATATATAAGAAEGFDLAAVEQGTAEDGGDGGFSLLENLCPTRRGVLGLGLALGFSASAIGQALAGGESMTLYQDAEDKYSILVPGEWTKGEGSAGVRKVTAFFPENGSNANVNIVITGLGADYTSLGSFGSADAFAENLVNSMDRAWKKPPGQAAKLVDSAAKNGMYYIEYTVQKPGEAKRHLISVVGIANNGWVNRLYTVTGQYWEDDSEKYKASLHKAVSSFRLS